MDLMPRPFWVGVGDGGRVSLRGLTMDLMPLTDGADLVRTRSPIAYTEAEQQFSLFMQRKLHRLLRGAENNLILMRRYCQDRPEVAFFLPSRIEKQQIRCQVAEGIVQCVLRFLDPFAPGGPIAQQVRSDRLIEIQTFPTQYPHIVVERTDVFQRQSGQCLYIEWQAVRVQNQRKSTLVNRALDIANLGLELVRFIRP